MTLIINLDSRIEILDGIEFKIKPLNQSGLEKLGTFANQSMKGEDNQSSGLQMISNPALDKILLEIIPHHVEMIGTFQIQEDGKLRDGTLEDIFTIDSGAFLTLKTKLIGALMTGSNLTEKESEQAKKQ